MLKILGFFYFILSPTILLATSAGPLAPGTGANDNSAGTQAWSNPSNIKVDDGNYASCTIGFDGITSQLLKATNFGFSIPNGATVNGIQVDVKRYVVLFDGAIKDTKIRLVRAGVMETTDKSSSNAWPTSEGTATYGNGSDLWGATWTPSDINNSGFGFILQAIGVGNTDIDTAQVGYVTITVSYTPSGTSDLLEDDYP